MLNISILKTAVLLEYSKQDKSGNSVYNQNLGYKTLLFGGESSWLEL